jgi:hypothetical protein
MNTEEIASRLVTLCRNGQLEQAKEELFANDIISIEPKEGLLAKETKGMEAIRRKAELFISHVDDFFENTISDPIFAGEYFCVAWLSDLKMKGEQRKTNYEICVYKTKDGKIVSEQFFY